MQDLLAPGSIKGTPIPAHSYREILIEYDYVCAAHTLIGAKLRPGHLSFVTYRVHITGRVACDRIVSLVYDPEECDAA